MDEPSKAPSTVSISSSPQTSLDIEDAITVDSEDSFDETGKQKQNLERSYIRCTLFVMLFATAISCGMLGVTLYLAVLKTNEQPLLTSDSNSKSAIPVQQPTLGQKLDGLLSQLSGKEEISAFEAGNDMETGCPGNWTEYNERCYHYSRTPVHVSDAEAYCSNKGGTPLNIKDEAIPEFIMTEVRKFVGCCLYDLSLQRNETDLLENIDEEIAGSLFIPYDPEWNIMNDLGRLADDSSHSVTRLPLPSNSYQTPNSFDSLLKKTTAQLTTDTEITRSNAGTTQLDIVDRAEETTAHAPELLPRISRSVAQQTHGSAQNHGFASQIQHDQDSKVSIAMKISSFEIFCKRYELYLPEWRESCCNGGNFQICERKPEVF